MGSVENRKKIRINEGKKKTTTTMGEWKIKCEGWKENKNMEVCRLKKKNNDREKQKKKMEEEKRNKNKFVADELK